MKIEEYDIKSLEIISRRWKINGRIGQKEEWEIGEPSLTQESRELIASSSSNPYIVRKDALTEFEFRIRNLPYASDVFSVEIDQEKDQIVVRTSNKKYFKRIDIPDMARAKLRLCSDSLHWNFANTILTISYKKPEEILLHESKIRQKFKELNLKGPKEGDMECTYQ